MIELKTLKDMDWEDMLQIEDPFFAKSEIRESFQDNQGMEDILGLDFLINDDFSGMPRRDDFALNQILDDLESGRLFLLKSAPCDPVVKWEQSDDSTVGGRWVKNKSLSTCTNMAIDSLITAIKPSQKAAAASSPNEVADEAEVEQEKFIQKAEYTSHQSSPVVGSEGAKTHTGNNNELKIKGTFYFGGAGLNGEYIDGMVKALTDAGINNTSAIGPEGLSASSLLPGGAVIDAVVGYLALSEKMNNFPHALKSTNDNKGQFNLIGYSFGSLLAAQFAAKYADVGITVDSLVLIGAPISKKFLNQLQNHKNIRKVIVKNLTQYGDPISAGMDVGMFNAYSIVETLSDQDENKNGSGHFYYRCTNCGDTGQQRRKLLAEELYREGLR